MNYPRAIGTAGFNGGGKDSLADTIVECLQAKRIEAVHMSLSDALRLVVRQREGMAADEAVPRELLGKTSDALVAEYHHPGALVLAVRKQLDIGTLVLSSVRRTGEAEAIQLELSGFTAFANASDATRLSRIKGRGRGDEAIETTADLLRAEFKERYGDQSRPNDPGVMCIEDVRSYVLRQHGADYIVDNEGTLEQLRSNASRLIDLALA